MAGSVSGSSVRTQKRFCGLWMGCTVGLGPARGDQAAAGVKGLWAGVPPGGQIGRGLGGVRVMLYRNTPLFSTSPCLLRQSVSAGIPMPTDQSSQGKGPSGKRRPCVGLGIRG